MRIMKKLGTVLVVAFLTVVQHGRTEDIPIGGIFDRNEREEKLAFSQELERDILRFQMRPLMLDTDMQNSVTLSCAIGSLRQQGAFAFFASHTGNAVNTVNSYSSALELPVLSSNFASLSTRGKRNFDFYLRPNYAKAVADVIKEKAWTEMLYLFDSDEGLEQLNQLLETIRDMGYSAVIQMRRVSDGNDAFKALQELKANNKGIQMSQVLVHMKAKELEQFLSNQNAQKSQSYNYFFIVNMVIDEINLHSGNTNRCDDRYNTVFGFTMTNRDKNAGDMIETSVALAADAAKVLSETFQTLHKTKPELFKATTTPTPPTNGTICNTDPNLIHKWQHGSTIATAIRQTKIVTGLSGNVEFDDAGLRVNYTLNFLFAVPCDPQRTKFHASYWSSTNGLRSTDLRRQTSRLSNRTQIITSILATPYLMIREGSDLTGNDRYEGYSADLAQKVAGLVGFNYEIQLAKDGKYGAMSDDGSYNGMIGELIRHEADLAIAPLTITSGREKVVDFSVPFMSVGISMMMRKPYKEMPGIFHIFNSFSVGIWLSIVFAYIGVSIVQYLIGRLSTVGWHLRQEYISPDNLTLLNCFWYTMTGLLRQGCKHEPRSVSGRFLSGVWCIFALIMALSYVSNLFHFKTSERAEIPITSVDELAKQTDIKYGTIESGSTKDFFKFSSIPTYERMWAFMSAAEPSVFVRSTEEGVARVRESGGKYVFLTESTTNDYINQRLPCSTIKVGPNLDAKGYGIATPLGSELRDRITQAILELREKGTLADMERRWWHEKGQCGLPGPIQSHTDPPTFRMRHIIGVFYILVLCVMLAIIVAILELIYKSKVDATTKKITFLESVTANIKRAVTCCSAQKTNKCDTALADIESKTARAKP